MTKINIKKKFSSNLKKYRKKQKLTQEDLAHQVGVSVKYVQRLEGANTTPNVGIETVSKFAKALKVSPYLLLK